MVTSHRPTQDDPAARQKPIAAGETRNAATLRGERGSDGAAAAGRGGVRSPCRAGASGAPGGPRTASPRPNRPLRSPACPDLRAESDVSAERYAAGPARRPERAALVEAEIADGLTAVSAHAPDGGRYDAASILVRVFTEPVALLMVPLRGDGLSVPELGAAIEAQCGDAVRRRMEDAGIAWPGHAPTNGLQPLARPSYLASRDVQCSRRRRGSRSRSVPGIARIAAGGCWRASSRRAIRPRTC